MDLLYWQSMKVRYYTYTFTVCILGLAHEALCHISPFWAVRRLTTPYIQYVVHKRSLEHVHEKFWNSNIHSKTGLQLDSVNLGSSCTLQCTGNFKVMNKPHSSIADALPSALGCRFDSHQGQTVCHKNRCLFCFWVLGNVF